MRMKQATWALALLAGLSAGAARAATCNTGDFSTWLQGVKQEAAGKGISQRGVSALDNVAFDPAVIRKDRGQGVFRQSFEQFAPHRVNPLLPAGRARMRSQAATLSRIEGQYGVPGAVLVAIWGLETSFGGGQRRVLSIASLARDPRL